VNYFTSYYKRKEEATDSEELKTVLEAPDFNITIKTYVEDTTATADDVIYELLTGIIEEKHEMIM
jgi:hypothetical protein